MEFARNTNSGETDLLSLIIDILDLSRSEAGRVTIELAEMSIFQLRQHLERTFRQLAHDKGLGFSIHVVPARPDTIRIDEKRLQQVVLNLLSNAFKFTSDGEVQLEIHLVANAASGGQKRRGPSLAIAVRLLGSASPRLSRSSSSRRSSRPTVRLAASMGERALVSPSAARSRGSLRASSVWRAHPAAAQCSL